MNLTRRKICQVGVFLIGSAFVPSVFGQDNKSCHTLHPPEPDEFDLLRLRDRKTPNPPRTEPRERGQEFCNCLERLFGMTTKLREVVVRQPMSEVFSVQVYRQAELIERIAKQLKQLARG